MHSCTCAPARFSAPSAGISPTQTAVLSLAERIEHAVDLLSPAREFLRLLADCGSANSDTHTDLPADSLVVTLQDVAEQLGEAETALDALSRDACDTARDALEAQALRVHAVRHLLLTLHGAIGQQCRDRHQVQADAFAGTMGRLAERVAGVEAALLAIAFPSRDALPSMPAAPSAPPPLDPPPHAAIRVPRPPMPPAPRPSRSTPATRTARTARTTHAQEAVCA